MRPILAGLLLLALAACGGGSDSASAPPNPLAGAEWIAQEIGARPVVDGHPATLLVTADGSVSGKSGCNGFAGASVVSDDSISFGELISTKMGCADPQMAQETRYFAALAATRRFLVDDDTLRLLDGGGATVVLYER